MLIGEPRLQVARVMVGRVGVGRKWLSMVHWWLFFFDPGSQDPPPILPTIHVVEFSRLNWLSCDAVIPAGITALDS